MPNQVLGHPNIGMMFKRPYLRFLLWAYLSSETNALRTSELAHDPRLWEFMEAATAFTYTILNKVAYPRSAGRTEAPVSVVGGDTDRRRPAAGTRRMGGRPPGPGPRTPAGDRPGRARVDLLV